MGLHQVTPPIEAPSPGDGSVRKRVCKACDRCRLKKSKCDGASPCSRCKADNAICFFGERKKSHDKVYPKGYVEMLEIQQTQLVAGLQELYRLIRTGQGWIGSPLKDTNHGSPLTHDILERLGVLKQDGHAAVENFEEDFNTMQQRLIASGAGLMPHETSSDTNSEIDQSPIFEQLSHRQSAFTDSFGMNRFPPTPPSHSPYPKSVQTVAPLKTQSRAQTAPLQMGMSWTSPGVAFDSNMEFIGKFDSPISFESLPPQMFQNQMPYGNSNLCLPMRDWAEEDDFQRFFNATPL